VGGAKANRSCHDGRSTPRERGSGGAPKQRCLGPGGRVGGGAIQVRRSWRHPRRGPLKIPTLLPVAAGIITRRISILPLRPIERRIGGAGRRPGDGEALIQLDGETPTSGAEVEWRKGDGQLGQIRAQDLNADRATPTERPRIDLDELADCLGHELHDLRGPDLRLNWETEDPNPHRGQRRRGVRVGSRGPDRDLQLVDRQGERGAASTEAKDLH
jgi:hypothetical protein